MIARDLPLAEFLNLSADGGGSLARLSYWQKSHSRGAIRRFGEFLGREPLISDLAPEAFWDFDAWQRQRVNPATAAKRRDTLRMVWRRAVASGLTDVMPTRKNSREQQAKEQYVIESAPLLYLAREVARAQLARSKTDRRAQRAAARRAASQAKAEIRAQQKSAAKPIRENQIRQRREASLLELPSHAIHHFLMGRFVDLRKLKPRALAHYRMAVVRLEKCIERYSVLTDLNEEKLDTLRNWMATEGYANWTIDATALLLRAIWAHAFREGLLPNPPAGWHPVEPETKALDITGPLEAHRAALAREAQQSRSESPGVVIGNAIRRVSKLLKSLKPNPTPKRAVKPIEFVLRLDATAAATLTIRELLSEYWRYAETYYGESYEVQMLRHAARPLEQVFGDELVKDFGPRKLKIIREMLLNGWTDANGKRYAPLSRKMINGRIDRIKRIFRWAASEELAPSSLSHALSTVEGLKAGRTTARETPPVLPVDDAIVEATLPHLPPVVRDMVRFQRLTGCRPGEVLILRPCDVDQSASEWVFRPYRHKSQHKGRGRTVYIGPKAQAVLRPYLERDSSAYCFSPRDSEIWRYSAMRYSRKSRVQPSQVKRHEESLGRQRKRLSRECYDNHSYSKAIARACKVAGVPHWHPNQLRHSLATETRRLFGLEAAQHVLGHAKADVTQIYAEKSQSLAAEVMQKIG